MIIKKFLIQKFKDLGISLTEKEIQDGIFFKHALDGLLFLTDEYDKAPEDVLDDIREQRELNMPVFEAMLSETEEMEKEENLDKNLRNNNLQDEILEKKRSNSDAEKTEKLAEKYFRRLEIFKYPFKIQSPEFLGESFTEKLNSLFFATPYDTRNNFNGKLTEDHFFNHLFVRTPELESLRTELWGKVKLEDKPCPPIFLNGFSGNGKTTFLKWFIRSDINKSFEHHYFDFADIQKKKANTPRKKIQELLFKQLIKQLVKEFIQGKNQHIIIQNALEYENYFKGVLSENFYEILIKSLKVNKWKGEGLLSKKVISRLDFSDIFVLCFLMIGQKLKSVQNSKPLILYFDNFDDISNRNLEASFRSQFLLVYEKLFNRMPERLGSKKFHLLDLKKKIRFVFCLRDENITEPPPLNPLDNYYSSDELNCYLISSGQKIMEKRLRLAKRLFLHSENDSGIPKVIGKIIEDKYSKKVFLPLFNYDYRKLISFILKMKGLSEEKDNKRFNLKKYESISEISETGARGILYEGFIRGLWESAFLKNFANDFETDIKLGVCNPIRVILTILLNKCRYVRSTSLDGETIEAERIGLADFVDTLEGIYPTDQIIKILQKYYLCNKHSWAHLIAIFNKKIAHEGDFSEELELFDKIKLSNNPTEKRFFKDQLNVIKIQINPSGFIYLKYLIVHFEFFSRLAKNNKPLFEALTFQSNEMRFEFENIIDRVYDRVANNCKMMDKFFIDKFEKERKYSTERFLKSSFSFKYLDEEGTMYPSQKGVLHFERIIINHIEYLEEFRWYLLKSEIFSRYVRMVPFAHSKKYTIPIINRILVNKILKYVLLLEEYGKELTADKVKKYHSCIEYIDKKRDLNIRINLETGEKLLAQNAYCGEFSKTLEPPIFAYI